MPPPSAFTTYRGTRAFGSFSFAACRAIQSLRCARRSWRSLGCAASSVRTAWLSFHKLQTTARTRGAERAPEAVEVQQLLHVFVLARRVTARSAVEGERDAERREETEEARSPDAQPLEFGLRLGHAGQLEEEHDARPVPGRERPGER